MSRNASSYIIMLINFHLILIIILCTVQFSHCFPTQTSTYSNLKRISELQSIQRFQLANPLFSWNPAISQYNECISKLQESRETRNGISNIFGPFFLYKIEGVPLKWIPFSPSKLHICICIYITLIVLSNYYPDYHAALAYLQASLFHGQDFPLRTFNKNSKEVMQTTLLL